ncbi:MAG: 2-C-methyl-D-erythritol 2,4-cyclodiphosphate synthase [Melioribacteraceae bacterium]|nr:MAG: 2-C-methyl-D-erythritol 2,4-cyclodiphosphate synthase [Melioribacteraceae bacterium]
MKLPYRTGFGYDVHAFAPDRDLIIGGVNIPYEKGLAGHSDADVLLHAISDALLGALALGDIGKHFPDTDPKYKGADSKILLKEVYKLVLENGYIIGNVDSTIAAQKPKMAPHIDKMREIIAGLLDCDISQVAVKATTTEKLGFVGEEKGIAAYANILIMENHDA